MTKQKFLNILDYLWRVPLMFGGWCFIVVAFALIMSDERTIGLGLGAIGLLLVWPYYRKRYQKRIVAAWQRLLPKSTILSSIQHTSSQVKLTFQQRVHLFWLRVREIDRILLAEESVSIDREKHVCLNCGHEYEGYYCPNCSQDKRKDHIDWHQLVIGMLSDAVNFDGSTIRTLYELLRKPASVFDRYYSGQHERYSNPMKFLLFAGVTYALMSLFFPPLNVAVYLSDGSPIQNWFAAFAGNIVIFQCLLSLIVEFYPLYWAFRHTERGRHMNKVDFYILMLYILGMDFFFRAIFCIPCHWSGWWHVLRILLFFVYQFWVLKTFFRLNLREITYRYAYKYILYVVCIIPLLVSTLILDVIASTTDDSKAWRFVSSSLFGGIEINNRTDIERLVKERNQALQPGIFGATVQNPLHANEYLIEGKYVIIVINNDHIDPTCFTSATQRDTVANEFVQSLPTQCESTMDFMEGVYRSMYELKIRYHNQQTNCDIDIPIPKHILKGYCNVSKP